MATITPVSPSVSGNTVTGTTPTAADTIPCAAYNIIFLVIRTGATNTYQCTVDDPTTQAPPGTLSGGAFNPDVTSGLVATNSAKVMRLDCGRFRDVNGNINITSASTPAGTTLEAYGI